jgi:hypothetical protein
MTPLGFTTRQITNAYRVHEPTSGLGLLATILFATESNSSTPRLMTRMIFVSDGCPRRRRSSTVTRPNARASRRSERKGDLVHTCPFRICSTKKNDAPRLERGSSNGPRARVVAAWCAAALAPARRVRIMTRTRMVLMGSLLAFFSLAVVTSSASAQSSCDAHACISHCSHQYGPSGSSGGIGDLGAVQSCVNGCRRNSQACEDRARKEEQARQYRPTFGAQDKVDCSRARSPIGC